MVLLRNLLESCECPRNCKTTLVGAFDCLIDGEAARSGGASLRLLVERDAYEHGGIIPRFLVERDAHDHEGIIPRLLVERKERVYAFFALRVSEHCPDVPVDIPRRGKECDQAEAQGILRCPLRSAAEVPPRAEVKPNCSDEKPKSSNRPSARPN